MEPILRIRQDVRKACAQVAAVKDPDMALLFCYIAARGEGCALPEPQQLGLDENRLQKDGRQGQLSVSGAVHRCIRT